MRRITRYVGAAAAAALVVAGAVVGINAVLQPAQAANGADFDPGYIVSDEQFYNGSAMTADEVQNFLNEQGSGCTGNCLKDYHMDTPTMAADNLCDTYVGASNESAAQIITKVGQACNISQKTLLVLLQKETSLVSIDDPASWRYDRAMGYYCPDDPSRPGWCAPEYGGFFNQVYNAAAQYQRYRQTPDDWNYVAGRTNNILYHPDAGCGTKPVFIENAATAGLYIYTPYTPNQAALDNLYGEGDGCSAYGNRNFWRLWTDWFGSPTGPSIARAPLTSPKAVLDEAAVNEDGTVTLNGWAFDPDVPTDSIRVHVYIDGKPAASIAADGPRADVNTAYDSLETDAVGFTYTTPVLAPGKHRIQVYAINQGAGSNTELLKDLEVTGPSLNPDGELEEATANSDGTVTLRGWVFDPDATNPTVRVHIYLDGKAYRSIAAESERADVDPTGDRSASTALGFEVTTGVLSDGDHHLEVYAINQGAGSNVRVGDTKLTVKAEPAPPAEELEDETEDETEDESVVLPSQSAPTFTEAPSVPAPGADETETPAAYDENDDKANESAAATEKPADGATTAPADGAKADAAEAEPDGSDRTSESAGKVEPLTVVPPAADAAQEPADEAADQQATDQQAADQQATEEQAPAQAEPEQQAAEQQPAADQQTEGDLAVTGLMQPIPFAVIVVAVLAAGLGILLITRRARERNLDEAI